MEREAKETEGELPEWMKRELRPTGRSQSTELPTMHISPETLRAMSGPALRTFFRIVDLWSMSEAEQVRTLGISWSATLDRWREGNDEGFTAETLERVSLIFGIFKAINILLPDTAQADAWIRAPNTAPLFGGRSAMALIASGDPADLYAVRRHLDAQLNG